MSEPATMVSNKKDEVLFNPFPGLRPFTIEESHLFFGREGQSDEVLKNLSENRFVAVLGASGSGKSSLMYCGLVPILHGGFITEAGSKWRIIATRPGLAPIDNLAEALVKNDYEGTNHVDEKELHYRKAIFSSIIRRSSLGLKEAVKVLNPAKNENFLILVDQFEELFRFKKTLNNINSFNESVAFVKLLLESIRQTEVPIYIVITMRSDFIGECAQFQELTRLINDSHYLIPQMTRDDLTEAIVGPVAVGGGKMTPHLVQQLLNDVGDNPDQLPILQHALMRTWDYWTKHRTPGQKIGISHYESIGKMEKALSEHANEAFDELSVEEKRVCESLFKTLTERGGDNRGIRHPTSVEEIAAIAVASTDDVKTVIETFRKPGRSFLSPSGVKLTDKTVIDISHESLMRIWDKLKIWVDEEAAAVQMYKRLADSAARFQEGKTGLWKQPDLQLAINWREKQKPTLVWAKRHHPAYERTMVYLETSEKEFKIEEENKIKLQKRALRRSKITALILGTAAIFSLGFMLWAVIQQQEATKQKVIAEQQTIEAKTQKQNAEKSAAEAKKAQILAEEQKEKAIEQEKLAKANADEAKKQQGIATKKSIEATLAQSQAEKSADEAKKAQILAEAQKTAAEKAKEEAFRLRMLSISKSMAVNSQQVNTDKDLKALLAYQSYLFNNKYGGLQHDPDIYNSLYLTLKELNEDSYNILNGHTDAVRALVFDNKNNRIISAGSDGKILAWDKMNDSTKFSTIYENGFINRSLAISPDGKWLACGTQNSIVQLFQLNAPKGEPINVNVNKSIIWDMSFSPDNQYLYIAGSDTNLNRIDLTNLNNELIAHCSSVIKCFSMSPDGKTIAAGTNDGSIVYWDINNNFSKQEVKIDDKTIFAIQYSNDGALLATGDQEGLVKIWDVKSKNKLMTLSGHKARVNNIQFDPQNKLIATSSFDGTVQLWESSNLGNRPVVLKDQSTWVLSLSFNKAGDKLYTGSKNGKIQVWQTKTEPMTKGLCSKISRNMTQDEWKTYIATDIDYEKTCPDLPVGE
ncbi:MAG: hypothetical protein GXO79_07225 [Chlorobi bacterium]|nr:hypothetical protein [Chlorobiota bacterium]